MNKLTKQKIGLVVAVAYILVQMPVNGRSAAEIRYVTSVDGSKQPAMFYAPDTTNATPLVVALHTWSGNYKQKYHKKIEQWCIKKGWAYIHPDFRGPNNRPEATGSDLVVKDIVSAVEYAKKNANIDPSAIYLVGTSGGGYASLLMAGRHPEIWAGVSAWVPISNLREWYFSTKRAKIKYYKDLVSSCGGAPGTDAEVDAEYTKRSAITWLKNAKGVPLHISAGIHDGHKRHSVPVSQSIRAFNVLAKPRDRISDADIAYFVSKEAVPPHLKTAIEDKSYGAKKVLFRRKSGTVTLTIFNGAHELVPGAAIAWIEANYNKTHKTK